ncbi:FtsX-like permease family protein [Roseivirga sp. E12]|uniref:ABC transporter permease n=1 Tax=Roseivirga sp. E12 TaxID=2819237 RepID=UPI001ABCA8C2|nr:ABC transporter permease [Roseivirga sp. E12]
MLPEDHIPKFCNWLFSVLCKEELYNELAGDLEETFAENYQLLGLKKARSIYRKEVFKMLRPSVVRRFKLLPTLSPIDMIKNYLKISIRNIWRDKEHSFISIFGLATGIVASILIFQYVNFESSYDLMHDQSKGDIYRLSRISTDMTSGEIDSKASSHYMAIQSSIVDDMPEVMSATHLYPLPGVLSHETQGYNTENIFFATGSFFDIFDFKLLQGSAADLDQPGSIFLSQTEAIRIFGSENVLNKVITFNATDFPWELQLQVKGIYEDLPENTHLPNPQALLCAKQVNEQMAVFFPQMDENELKWRLTGYHTYIKVLPGTIKSDLSSKLVEWIKTYRAPFNKNQGREHSIQAHSIRDIHFIKDYDSQLKPAGDQKIITLFKIIGVLIVLIAWTNFVNLASAKAVKRAKEIGIRKSLGAYKKQLIQQFLLEAILINLLALLLAIGIVLLVIPKFHQLIGSEAFDYFGSFIPFWSTYLATFLLGSIVTGLYPALVLTRFEPIKVLRGNFASSSQGSSLRKSLILLQFAIVLVMLSGVMAIRSQIQFMMDADMGMNISQTLAIQGPPGYLRDSTYAQKTQAFQGEVERNSGVKATTLSSILPGIRNNFFQTTNRLDRPSGETVMLYRSFADHDYVSFHDLEIISGRDFDESLIGDQNVILLNREAVERFNFESPEDAIGKRLDFANDVTPLIVGVVENFNQMGVNFAIEPLAIELINGGGNFINLRVETKNIAETMQFLESSYEAFFPGSPFQASFIDQNFNTLYEADQRFNQALQFFAIVAIFISCLGIFGLSSFLINQKMKEVSIRKVLGANVLEIIRVLTTEYIWLVSISTLVAVPVAYFLINNWLDSFLVRVNVNILFFALPVIGLMMIILITIGHKTKKAALTNPAKTLKSE